MSLTKIPFENVKIVGRSKFNVEPLALPSSSIFVLSGDRNYRGTAIDSNGTKMFVAEGPGGEEWGNTNNYFFPGFIYISYNAGTTWARVGPGATTGIPVVWWFDMACDDRGTYVYAFGGYSNELFGPVWRSTDSGLTWTNSPITGIRTNYNRGAGKITCDSTGRIVYTTDAYKIFRSDNYGETWSDITPTNSSYGGANGSVKELCCDASGTKLFICTSIFPWAWGQPGSGLYLSSNSGNSWSEVSLSSLPPSYYSIYNWYCSMSRDGSTLFITGSPPCVSTDFGLTWTQTANTELAPNFIAGNKLYSSRSTGLVVSNNYGTTWTTLTSAGGWHYISPAPTLNPTKMIGIRNSTGVFKTNNGGANWTRIL